MEKVSIIITTYNYAEYLADAIESALDAKPLEVIVVDDGSKDNPLRIAKDYPVRFFRQTNRGLPSARNTGLMNSHGTWILPLDADDTISPFYLDSAYGIMADADVIYPDLQFFGERNDRAVCNAPFTKENLQRENLLPYCSLIRKRILLDCGGWNTKMVWGFEDYELWIELFERGARFKHLPQFMFNYRKHGKSMIGELIASHHKETLMQLQTIHPRFYT